MTTEGPLVLTIDDTTELRLESEADASVIYRTIRDNRTFLKQWVYWVKDDYSEQDNLNAIQDNYRDYLQGKCYVMGVYVSGQFAGSIDIRDIQTGEAEVGYWLGEKFTGKGLATKSLNALIKYVCDHHDIKRLELFTAIDNGASNRVAEKLGFHKVGKVENINRENHYVKEC